ncbi:MAG: ROK family transcriptional regulator [Bifidobacteriaceae bacterium]|nr:ROK family transcriptional regulator [Bifidobacteriaceae bacterium]
MARREGGLSGVRLRPTAKAHPGHSRTHNRSLVLSSLFHTGPLSRAELARTTGLTRVTISDLVAQLAAEGLIEDLGARTEARVGKPASLIDINASGHVVAALDLSDINQARGALVTLRGEIVGRATVKTAGAAGEAVLDHAAALAKKLIGKVSEARLLGVGVAAPGVVRPDGVVTYAKDYQWRDFALAQTLHDRLKPDPDAPVFVANDANLRALAEFTFAGASAQGLMEVSLTDGLGAGILLDGSLLLGPSNAAGEIGHIPAMAGGEPCTCGRSGCLETVLNRRVLGTGRATGSASLDAGTNPDPATLAKVGESTAAVLGPIVSAFNLSDLVFADPRGMFTPVVLAAIRDGLAQRLLPEIMADLDVRVSALGSDAALLGAVALVLSEQLGLT